MHTDAETFCILFAEVGVPPSVIPPYGSVLYPWVPAGAERKLPSIGPVLIEPALIELVLPGLVVDSPGWSAADCVVCNPPLFDQNLCFAQRIKNLAVEKLVA